MSTAELSLPSQEALELADYKLGTTTSDFDMIRRQVERCSKGEVTTAQEYLYRKSEGFESPGGEDPGYNQDELARLVVFATSALRDAESIKNDALAIQREALNLYYEQGPIVDWDTHYALVRAWHHEVASDDA